MNMYVDLSILCGQLVWLLVVNIAHHSCCATDDLYQGMGEQLDEIRELIKKGGGDMDAEGAADAFLADPEDTWDATRAWFERMYQRIMYRSGDNEWANVVEKVEKIQDTRPSMQLSQSVSMVVPKTGGTGSLRGGAVFK
jgi:hypothetical protein